LCATQKEPLRPMPKPTKPTEPLCSAVTSPTTSRPSGARAFE